MPIGTNGATISLSDSSVAEIAVTTEDVFTFAGKHIDTHVEIRFLKAGRLTITAQLDTLSAATTVDVLSLAPSTAVAVDSFAIVEFRVPCVGSCNYLAYLPVFRFREATGKATATVAGVSIYLDGGMSLGPCRGEFTLQAGESLEVTGLESYIWLTGLLGVRLDGTRVEGDSATAELLVRDGTGGYARLEKRGPILKLEANPVVPTSPDPGWSC
jgi:hypothetical protein